MPRKATEEVSLEKKIETIKKIIEAMEQKNISLEKAVPAFEEGMSLIKECQTLISDMEQKVSILIGDSEGQEKLEPFTKINSIPSDSTQ